MDKIKRLSIIIPVFNEETTINLILENVIKCHAKGLEKEIIVINDGSTDNTKQLLDSRPNRDDLRIIHLEQNSGKGYAVKQGLLQSTGDVVVVQDADLEYDPEDWDLMLKPILEGHADAVYGSRFIGRGPRRSLYIIHHIGNKFLTLISNLLTGYNISDMETCYKMIQGDLAREIAQTLESRDFRIEPEITAKLAKRKARLYEVGISYYGRTYEEGKKITWRSGIKALWAIVKFNLFH